MKRDTDKNTLYTKTHKKRLKRTQHDRLQQATATATPTTTLTLSEENVTVRKLRQQICDVLMYLLLSLA